MLNVMLLFLLVIGVPIAVIVGLGWLLFKGIDYIFNPVQKYEGKKENIYSEIEEDDNINVCFEIKTVEEPKTKKKFEFRPTTWEEFIGQEKAKKQCKLLIAKTKKGIRSHALIDGLRGHGKTTLCYLIGNYLNADMIEYIGKQVDENSIPDIIDKINASKSEYPILFIDEIDTMESESIKMLNPIIEQFRFNGKDIKPFLLLGATINKHKLIDSNPDTLDRIPTQIKMHRYNINEMQEIIKQYKRQLYSDVNLSEQNLYAIAENCKYNPRTAISLLEDFVVTLDFNEVLDIRDIKYKGLTEIDIKLLKTLHNSKKKDGELKPLGSSALAQRVGLSDKEYQIQYEPFLCEFGYILRVPSRVISEKGIEVLNKLS